MQHSPFILFYSTLSKWLALTILLGAFSDVRASGLPVYYWQQPTFVNFGDYLSMVLVERIVGEPVRLYQKKYPEKKLLAIGSLLYFANDGDVLWGCGYNNKWGGYNDKPALSQFTFHHLDIRAVRGPLTRAFIQNQFGLEVPEVYGDPALLLPYFFPEFKKAEEPTHEYIVIPHFSEKKLFPLGEGVTIVHPTEPWHVVIEKILDSRFVIASSLHGIIVAEAYGIPARMLRVTDHEPLFKYEDYYLATGRPDFQFATSVEEALEMGGEPPASCDLQALYNAFPFEFWPEVEFKHPEFNL